MEEQKSNLLRKRLNLFMINYLLDPYLNNLTTGLFISYLFEDFDDKNLENWDN